MNRLLQTWTQHPSDWHTPFGLTIKQNTEIKARSSALRHFMIIEVVRLPIVLQVCQLKMILIGLFRFWAAENMTINRILDLF